MARHRKKTPPDPKRFFLRIAEHIDEHQYGTVAEVAKVTGLTRHYVRKLLRNDSESVNLSVLAKIADYLVRKGKLTPDQVPQELFGRAPQRFWQLLAERKEIHMYMGVRTDPDFNDKVVIAADALLQGNMLFRWTGIEPAFGSPARTPPEPARQVIDLRTVTTWRHRKNKKDDDKIRREATAAYEDFDRSAADRAMVALGSVKSDPLVDLIIGNLFVGSRPFASEDQVEQDRNRSCPFMLLYRSTDPKPDSCCGGLRLSKQNKGMGPGIYYEEEGGNWAYAPWNDANADCALVLYRLVKSPSRLEMVLGGFSGRATRFLANFLRKVEHDWFWPASYDEGNLAVGAFIVTFEVANQEVVGDPRIVRLDRSVLERRLSVKNPEKGDADIDSTDDSDS